MRSKEKLTNYDKRKLTYDNKGAYSFAELKR